MWDPRQGIEASQPVLEQVKDLSPADLLCDALVFGLRLNAGVDPYALAARFVDPTGRCFSEHQRGRKRCTYSHSVHCLLADVRSHTGYGSQA